jgi:Rrf2 family protein
MKLSRSASYAIHAVVYITHRTPGPRVSGANAAQELNIPEAFLRRLLVALARERILTGIKGPNGGYRLARPAKKITFLDVIEAVEGPIRGVVGWEERGGKVAGALRAVVESAADQVRKQLAGVTIASLAQVDGRTQRSTRKPGRRGLLRS